MSHKKNSKNMNETMTSIKKGIFLAAILALAAGLVYFLISLIPGAVKPEKDIQARVAIARGIDTVTLKCSGGLDIIDPKSGEKMLEGIKRVDITASGDVLNIGGKVLNKGKILARGLGDNGIKFSGKVYRGDIYVMLAEDSGMDVVNYLPLEDYLKGVLPCEMNRLWPLAVLKAQAVASRSFAVHRITRRQNAEYDLTGDTFSQVYGGKSSERWRTTRAVEATRGKVLSYEGKVVPGYFHSCCGGHTRSASVAWGDKRKPFSGIRCSWCRWTPHSRWKARVPMRELHKKLGEAGFPVADRIDDIREGTKDASGRLEYLNVNSRGKWIKVPVESFRQAAGRSIVKSANFRVKKYPFFYLLNGRGWGHGVGMCQWGAFGLGVRMVSASRILEIYYPGTEVTDIDKMPKTAALMKVIQK